MEATNFEYEENGKLLKFQFNGCKMVKCANCQKDFKNILNHIQKMDCGVTDTEDFARKFKHFTKLNFAEERKSNQNKWKQKSIAKQRNRNDSQLKADQNKWKRNSRVIKRKLNHC